jgi:branched-subunit amino acid transport protein
MQRQELMSAQSFHRWALTASTLEIRMLTFFNFGDVTGFPQYIRSTVSQTPVCVLFCLTHNNIPALISEYALSAWAPLKQ